jgi:transcription-repair coupling factor (superfamily II helicase)
MLQPYDEVTIRGAIEYELSRGGQVYFLHDKVKNIEFIAGMIRKLVPGARVGVGHGQLEGHKLEEVMLDFIEGNTDVLVCTTIVENGLDIPNANTIIVNEAQNFGLSDLHQLRGRVGRSNKKAYCYLLAPSPHLLPDLSAQAPAGHRAVQRPGQRHPHRHEGPRHPRRRRPARRGAERLHQRHRLRDLPQDPRGSRARTEGSEHFKPTSSTMPRAAATPWPAVARRDQSDDCIIETDLTMLIPNSYVSETAERLALYRKLDDIKDEPELQKFTTEVTDRFGPIPQQVDGADGGHPTCVGSASRSAWRRWC